MRINGQCRCGAIAFEAVVDPEQAEICHCTDCQTLSGSAFRTVVPAAKENFRLLRGTPKTYIKTAESGAKRIQAFCPECGTPLYSTSADSPTIYGIRLGAVAERHKLPPKKQYWTRSAQSWIDAIAAIPKVEKE